MQQRIIYRMEIEEPVEGSDEDTEELVNNVP